jgi:signal transduction histidine kinase
MNRETLRKLSFFAGLSEDDLDRLYSLAEPVSCTKGDYLMREGDPADALYVVIDGMFEVTKLAGDQEVVISGCKDGDVIGEIGLLEKTPRTATLRALKDSHLLKISTDSFYQMLCSRSAAEAIIGTMMLRLRNTEGMLMQTEKMAALGNMAAGLAHELNNPAAAVRRSTDQLTQALAAWQQATLLLGASGVRGDDASRLSELGSEVQARATEPIELDPLARSDRQDELESWLEEHGVEEPWDLAPALVSAGWDLAGLQVLSRYFTVDQLPAAVQWLASASLVYNLLHELGIGSSRISQIVKSVKAYSFLDQAPIQEISVREGLEDTLVMLRHKLRSGIHITRSYAPDLPRIEAYGSELNQVWTNIIDNAIDAMGDTGELTLRAYPEDGHVAVEITNDGPAIPPEVQARMFDPFFTTKGPGAGTGLGLHITRNIVQLKHHGQIKVSSRPGATTFRVTLPLELPQDTPAQPDQAQARARLETV